MTLDQAATTMAPTAAGPAHTGGQPALSARGLTKRFGDLLAANALDLDFYPGEIHAVLGENGAGKSTLMKMLYGYYQPDAGSVLVGGQPATLHSPADARRRGIGMVFQNFTLVPALTVLENVALLDRARSLRYDRAALRLRLLTLAASYGLAVNPDAVVRDLTVGERQRVEILKMLASNASILILDEPTSVLTPHEIDALLALLARLRADGYTVVLITHKLREVFQVADRITVLRRGQVAGSGLIGDFDEAALIGMMLGERGGGLEAITLAPVEQGDIALELAGVTVRGADGATVLRELSLRVHAGEIVGVAAVAGNGQEALAEVLLGAADRQAGEVLLGGIDVTYESAAARLRRGLAVIPEDLLAMGAVPSLTVGENLLLGGAARGLVRGFLLRPRQVQALAETLAAGAPFTLPPAGRTLGALSGGNAQRVVITREMGEHCRVLVAYHPSRGLDVASTRAVQQLIADARGNGRAVLLVSEDLDEVLALADRVVVMHRGHIAGSFSRAEADPMQIGRLMTGGQAA